MEPILKEIYESVIEADQDLVREKVAAALAQGLGAGKILNEGMVLAMTEVGRLFEEGEYFVPEMLICARAMQAGMVVIKPAMVEANVESSGKVVAGTVKGDLHDIGKNLVCMMLEGAACEIYDLGSDVTPQAFGEKVKEPLEHPVIRPSINAVAETYDLAQHDPAAQFTPCIVGQVQAHQAVDAVAQIEIL